MTAAVPHEPEYPVTTRSTPVAMSRPLFPCIPLPCPAYHTMHVGLLLSQLSQNIVHCSCWGRCGADVVAADLAKDTCADTIAAIQDMGRRAVFVPCDVRDRISVDDAVKEVER